MIVSSHPVELVLPPSLTPRAEGIHQSAIIRCLALENGFLEQELEEDLSLEDSRVITDQVAITRMCMGLAWEEFYIRTQLPEVVDHPGEMELDGIFMNPDGEGLEQVLTTWDASGRWRIRVHEVKCTYKSVNTVGFWPKPFDSATMRGGPMTSQFMWMTQVGGYCKAKGTNLASIHVLYVCGNYSYPIRPFAARYDIEFTDDELDSKWEMVRGYRDYRLEGTYDTRLVVPARPTTRPVARLLDPSGHWRTT